MLKKYFILVIGMLTVFMMLGGCVSSPCGQSTAQADGENTLNGQITAIDGSSITIAVGTMPERPQMNNSQQQGGADAASSATTGENENGPQGGAPPSGDTSRGDGNTPNGDTPRGDGNAPDDAGKGRGGMTLTGEKQTITVTDSTVITVRSGETAETGSLDDLQTGDTVTVAMTNGSVTSITVMRMGMAGGADAPRPQGTENDGSSL